MARPKLDRLDKRILSKLQRNADISIPDLGSRVGLSYSPCLRRVRRLEEAGLIRGKVAILDPDELGLSVNVIVDVYLKSRKDDARGMF